MSLNTVGAAGKPKVITGITATGTNQATALPLAGGLVSYEISTVASGTGVILPIPNIPSEVTIRNADPSDAVAVYPQVGGTIDGGSVNASYSLTAGSTVKFWASSATNWYSIVSASGGAGGTPGGSTNSLQYNNAGVFGGASAIAVGANNQLALAEIATPGTQVSGDRWTDSTQHCAAAFDGSATGANCLTNYRIGLLYSQGFATGGTANVTVTAGSEQAIIDTSNGVGTVNLPAGYLNVKGRTLRVSVRGIMSTIASAPGNHFVLFKLGTNYLATTAATALGTSKVNNAFTWDFLVITKATGSSGKLDITGSMIPLGGSTGAAYAVQGFMNSSSSTGSAASFSATPMTLDLTAAYTLGLFTNFSVGGTGNSITITHIVIEAIA